MYLKPTMHVSSYVNIAAAKAMKKISTYIFYVSMRFIRFDIKYFNIKQGGIDIPLTRPCLLALHRSISQKLDQNPLAIARVESEEVGDGKG